MLKTRLCGGPGLLNVQIDAAQTLTSVCGEPNYLSLHSISIYSAIHNQYFQTGSCFHHCEK